MRDAVAQKAQMVRPDSFVVTIFERVRRLPGRRAIAYSCRCHVDACASLRSGRAYRRLARSSWSAREDRAWLVVDSIMRLGYTSFERVDDDDFLFSGR